MLQGGVSRSGLPIALQTAHCIDPDHRVWAFGYLFALNGFPLDVELLRKQFLPLTANLKRFGFPLISDNYSPERGRASARSSFLHHLGVIILKLTMISSALAVALAATSFGAMAADTGFYAYGSASWAKSERKSQADATITNSGITAFTSHGDENDTGYKLQAGYRFNRYLAVEAGYVDLGKYTYDAASTVPIVATRNGNFKANGWTVGAVASLSVAEQFALFGKLGALNYESKYHCSGTGIACVDPDRSKDGTVLYYGVGADWNFVGNWFARAEYEIFQDVGSSFNAAGTTGVSKADIKTGSVGIGYRF